MAFIDAGDQFIALSAGRGQAGDDARHFGLVVDDAGAVREALEREGVKILPGRGLDFLDPWGNRVQVVQYDEIQFTKTDAAASQARRGGPRQDRGGRRRDARERAALGVLGEGGIRTGVSTCRTGYGGADGG